MNSNRKSLRVLHVASFEGNIGDVANHAGARFMFREHLTFSFSFVELEIREFYWKKRRFDDEFVRWANSFDLLVIGGGNYFELWVDNSATGTSIDITLSRLEHLTVPTIFYSLGVDIGQGYTKQSVTRFKAFIEMILGREDMIVCVRNDGSTRALHELLPDLKVGQIPVMPDGGFFAGRSLGILSVNQSAHTRVGINLAGDMLERRFSKGNSYEKFLKGMAEMSVGLLDMRENLEIEFVPHIWRDVVFLSELLPLIPDPYLRRRIAIASLKPTARGLDAFLRTYSEFDLVLGMRFHANVCPIGMGVPTRGLVNYPQIKLLYEELTMSDRAFDELSFEDSQKLQRLVVSDLENIHAIRAHFIHKMDLLNKMAGETLSKVNAWLLKRFE